MAEPPLVKPEVKYASQTTRIPRPISSGYELKQDLAPEIKRNLPSEISENKQHGLNINAPSFIPKIKHLGEIEKKKDFPGNNYNPYYNPLYIKGMNNMNYMNNMNNMTPMNNMNSNTNYFNPSYYSNNTYQKHFQYQQGFFPKNYPNNMNNAQNQYNNQFQNKHNIKPSEYNRNQNSQQAPLPNSYVTQTYNKQDNKSLNPLKNTNYKFIPKSMRESNNKPAEEGITSLNTEAPEYIPQNVALKKKEEEIKKMKEKEEKEKAEKKEEKETKETKGKENNKNEVKKEEQNQHKEAEKEEEKKNKVNDENTSEQKKKSNLFMLLEGKDEGNKKTKTNNKSKQIGNDKSDNTQSYKNKKKQKTLVEQKIEQVNTKGKKWKEEEERQKEEERKRKEEEEKIRREEEKRRKEEERKKREEEERKREEEEKRRRKEEEQKRKEEEELRKQMELEEQKRREEEEKNKVIEKKYFIVFKNRKSEKKEYKYTFEYIMQFKNWKISNEDELLTDSVKQHFKNFEEEEREGGKRKKNDGKINKNRSSAPEYSQQPKTGNTTTETPANSMEKWARKDMTKEIKAAEEFKQKLEETIQDDPIKRNLRGFLNMLTKDNYEQIKQDILGIIRDNVDYQIKFLDVLFQKAVLERAYVALYAKLCKELDKELPQKNAPKETKETKDGEKKPQKQTSIMRAKLLDKCKEIFQIKKNETFDEYIKEKDPQEREYKLKKFVLGNVYFITELIKIKILSKKIAPVCINNLFDRYESSKADQKLKLINLQAIVIFTDQFGSLVHAQEKKIDSKDAKLFKESIDKIFQKLDQVKDDQNLPGYIYYSIINLIEKRKNNYQMSKHEEYMIAKSRKEVEKELENQDQITQENINDKMKKGLIEYKDFIEEEGTSDKYQWKETTYLYDKKGKDLDDLLEGYIEGCGDFIEKESNIKYAKSYIKELIEYYSSKIHKKEKIMLKNRLINLFERVRDFALETPSIYDIYAYVIFIFLDNDIMEVQDLEGIIIEKDSIEEDYNIVSSIFKKVYKLYKIEKFKIELAKFSYINKNKDIFDWVFNQDENEEEEEQNEE